MEEKFGNLETYKEDRLAVFEAKIEQQLENEEITEAEAMGLMMEAIASIFIEILQISVESN